MSFVSLSGKYHRDKKSPPIGAEDLGDRHWKNAFSDSGWRFLTMDHAWGLARQCGSCMGSGCTELLFRCIFGKIWPKCKNMIFSNANLSLSCGREVGNGCATSPCTSDALAGVAPGHRGTLLLPSHPPHRKPNSSLNGDWELICCHKDYIKLIKIFFLRCRLSFWYV